MMHQYIDRSTGGVKDENLYFDDVITFLFDRKKENPKTLYNALASPVTTRFLSFLNYDMPSVLKGFLCQTSDSKNGHRCV